MLYLCGTCIWSGLNTPEQGERSPLGGIGAAPCLAAQWLAAARALEPPPPFSHDLRACRPLLRASPFLQSRVLLSPSSPSCLYQYPARQTNGAISAQMMNFSACRHYCPGYALSQSVSCVRGRGAFPWEGPEAPQPLLKRSGSQSFRSGSCEIQF